MKPFIVFLVLILGVPLAGISGNALVPVPLQVIQGNGKTVFTFTPAVRIVMTVPGLTAEARELQRIITLRTGIELALT